MHPHQGIQEVEEVTDVVKNHPGGVQHVVQLPEDHPAGDEDEVVEDGEVDDAEPVVVVSLAGVDGQLEPAPPTAPDLVLRVLLLVLRHEAEPVEEGVRGQTVLTGVSAVALINIQSSSDRANRLRPTFFSVMNLLTKLANLKRKSQTFPSKSSRVPRRAGVSGVGVLLLAGPNPAPGRLSQQPDHPPHTQLIAILLASPGHTARPVGNFDDDIAVHLSPLSHNRGSERRMSK